MQRLIKKTMTKALFFPTQGILRQTSCKNRPIAKIMIQTFSFPTQAYRVKKDHACRDRSRKYWFSLFFSSTGHTQTQKVLHVQTDQKTMIEPLLFLRQKYPGIKCPACTDWSRNKWLTIFFFQHAAYPNTKGPFKKNNDKASFFQTLGIPRHKKILHAQTD